MAFCQNLNLKNSTSSFENENTLLTSSQIFEEQQNIISVVVFMTSLLFTQVRIDQQ